MKVVWEEKDIRPGRKVRMEGCQEVWMIGYLFMGSSTCYTLVSLRDGMVSSPGQSKKDLADRLTKNGDIPIEILDKFPENEENLEE